MPDIDKLAPLIEQAAQAMRTDPDPRWAAVAHLMAGGPLGYARMIDGHPNRERMARNYEDAGRAADVARRFLAVDRELAETHGNAAYLADNLAAAKAERDEAEAEVEKLRAELAEVRRDLAANEGAEDARLSIAEATIERLTGPEARERLARHLYATALPRMLRRSGEIEWDEGQTKPEAVEDCRRRADELLAVIASKEG